MVKLYLDKTEIDMMETNHGFTASRVPLPEEGLTIEREISEELFSLDDRSKYTVCRYVDNRKGDHEEFVRRQLRDLSPEEKKLVRSMGFAC